MDKTCEKCGAVLVVRGPRFYCPACVIKNLFDEDDEEVAELERMAAEEEMVPELRPQHELLPQVPRHEVLELLGEGGFAKVYRAMQLEPVRRMVAVKVLRDEVASQHALARFELERQTLARMEHPAIARLFDAGQTLVGQPFFAMELVPGEPLTAFCKGNNVLLTERLRLFVQICHGVQHAHEKGVLHRDLKPSNLLVTGQGSNRQVKVIDFGIAKALEVVPEANSATTAVHQAIGTPGYMSPEQSQWGVAMVDARSDIYALGVVLYELITGYTPLQVEQRSSEEATRRHTAWHILPPSRVGGSLQLGNHEVRDLDAICIKALSQEPSLRYPSAAALGEDVARHLSDEPVTAVQHSWRYVIDKFTLRHRALVFGTSATLAAILVGFTVSVLLYLRAEEQKGMAESREVEVRRSLGMSYFREAQRLKAEGDPHSAVACLGRALQSDPRLEAAANDLEMLMAYGDFLQPRAPRLPIQKELGSIKNAAVSADGDTVALAYRKEDKRCIVAHQFSGAVWTSRLVSCAQEPKLLCTNVKGDLVAWSEDDSKLYQLDLTTNQEAHLWQASAKIEVVTMDNRLNCALVGLQNGEIWRVSTSSAVLVGTVKGSIRHIILTAQFCTTVATSHGEVRHWLPDMMGGEGMLLMKLTSEVTALHSVSDRQGQRVVAGDSKGYVAWVHVLGRSFLGEPVVRQLHQGRVTCVTAGQGMRSILSAGGAEDLRVRWTDTQTEQDRATPLETAGLVYRIIADEDDSAIILSGDASLRIWNRALNRASLLRRPQQSRQIATSPMGRSLLAEGPSHVEVLNMICHASSRLILHPGTPMVAPPPPRRLALSLTGRELLATDGAGGAFLWDANSLAYLQAKWKQPALDAVCMDDGPDVIITGDGAVLSVESSGAQPRVLVEPSATGEIHGRVLNATAPQPVEWQVAGLCPTGKAAVWAQLQGKRASDEVCEMRVADLVSGKIRRYQYNRLSAVAVSHASQRLAQGLRIGLLRVVRLGKHVVETETHHQSTITCLNFNGDGSKLISGSTDGTVVLWDVLPKLRMRGSLRCDGALRSVALSADGGRFSACTENALHVGDVGTISFLGQSVYLEHFAGDCVLSGDGSRCAVALSSGATMLVDLPKGKSTPPDWFYSFSSALAARDFKDADVIHTLPTATFTELHALVPQDKEYWSQFAQWIVTPAQQRPVTPWRELMPVDYFALLQNRGGDANRLEQRRIIPLAAPAARRAANR